jgi:hypothetical protein
MQILRPIADALTAGDQTRVRKVLREMGVPSRVANRGVAPAKHPGRGPGGHGGQGGQGNNALQPAVDSDCGPDPDDATAPPSGGCPHGAAPSRVGEWEW